MPLGGYRGMASKRTTNDSQLFLGLL